MASTSRHGSKAWPSRAGSASRNVYNQVKNKVGFGFEPMGEHQVKNIAEPITVYRVRLALGGCRRWEEAAVWRARSGRWRLRRRWH